MKNNINLINLINYIITFFLLYLIFYYLNYSFGIGRALDIVYSECGSSRVLRLRKTPVDSIVHSSLGVNMNTSIEKFEIKRSYVSSDSSGYASEQENNNNIVFIYAYYEKNKLYKDNLEYFLKNAILDNIDYYFIINGNNTINFPIANNIKVIHRENKGFDFGAYSYAIKKILKKEYDYYIFSNATVKGPYLNNNNKNWFDTFLELFIKNVKLVGTSICFTNYIKAIKKFNVESIYYVQSMFFIINRDLFNYLNKNNFFNDEELLNKEVILENIVINKEIKLSYLTYLSGGNINCYLSKYRNLDFRNIKNDINNSSFNGDPYFPNRYFCETIKPYDVIFYKNKRMIEDVVTLQNELKLHYDKNIINLCKSPLKK